MRIIAFIFSLLAIFAIGCGDDSGSSSSASSSGEVASNSGGSAGNSGGNTGGAPSTGGGMGGDMSGMMGGDMGEGGGDMGEGGGGMGGMGGMGGDMSEMMGGTMGEGGEGKFANRIRTDIDGVVRDLTKGMSETAEAFKRAAEFVDNANRRLASVYSLRTQLEMKIFP